MNIVISGTVGAGKSTLVSNLEKHFKKQDQLKSNFYYEKIENSNPMLDYFYLDSQNWSFLIQIDFLLDRFKNALSNSSKEAINIFDRHFLDDFIFVNSPVINNSFTSFELNLYNQVNQTLANKLNKDSKVDLFILLKAPLETLIERITQRGRNSELAIDKSYWIQLYDTYYNNKKVADYLEQNAKKVVILEIGNDSKQQIFQKTLKIIEESLI